MSEANYTSIFYLPYYSRFYNNTLSQVKGFKTKRSSFRKYTLKIPANVNVCLLEKIACRRVVRVLINACVRQGYPLSPELFYNGWDFIMQKSFRWWQPRKMNSDIFHWRSGVRCRKANKPIVLCLSQDPTKQK